jgi:hypothetical protein
MSNAAVLAIEESLLNLFKNMMNFLPAKYPYPGRNPSKL